MAMWKDNTAVRQPTPTTPPPAPEPARFDSAPRADLPSTPAPAPVSTPSPAPATPVVTRSSDMSRKASVIPSDIVIEGKIEGGGSVRIAGKFKGDVNVPGDLTIEVGATLTGGCRADKITIAVELEGNVQQATRVDLLATGVVVGDLKAGSLTVAAGARMRGQADFGWDEDKPGKRGNGSSSLS